MCPAPKAMTTNASQPKTAVFQCLALHRPMRAARFSDCFEEEIDMLRS
jgi:hypothetical protein